MTPHISVIVLNWNGKVLTAECLKTLQKVTYPNFSLFVVDNGSTDGSVEYMKNEFPNISLVELSQNFGYAAGNNRGFDAISSNNDSSHFVLFLNNDTLVESDFLDELANGITRFGSDHIYSPKTLYADHPKHIWYAGGTINLSLAIVEHVGIREPDGPGHAKDIQTDFVSGCSLLISTEKFKKLNGFDESFGMYSEDVDLCLRAAKMGSSCYMIANSKIFHKVSASMGGNWSFRKNLRKLRSLMKLIQRHRGVLVMIMSTVSLIYQIPRQYFNSRKFIQ
ncbi:MAG: glycosyltransferase family 2 protein [Candidatus Marinimicrobia bacterium]|nr:glycosyltransferase family 2 protein [Candidatus Neomarinimicrobiota bacterium]